MKRYLTDTSGSALATVMLIAIAIFVIAASFVMGHAGKLRLLNADIGRMHAYYAAEAALYKTLWYLSGHGGRDLTWRPRQEEIATVDQQKARVTVSQRGGFLQIDAIAKYKNQVENVSVLVGQKMPNEFDQAIIVGGVDHALVLTGATEIRGDVTVGSGGVKSGTLKGVKFSGDRLVHGEVRKVTPPQMPPFDDSNMLRAMATAQSDLQAALTSEIEPGIERLKVAGQVDLDTLLDSVSAEMLFLFSDEPLQISGSRKIVKPITIVSSGRIEIDGDPELADAIIYSQDAVIISGKVKGRLQILSDKRIVIKGNAKLVYPSLAFCKPQVLDSRISGRIDLLENAQMSGTIALGRLNHGDKKLPNDSRVVIEKSVDFSGVVYSSNETTLLGTVAGAVITERFFLYESPTSYINWLKDARVNRLALPSEFKMPLLFGKKPQLEIVKWF